MPAKFKSDAEFQQRFWERVEKTDTCWLWTGAKGPFGHGNIRRRPVTWMTHRLSWEWAYGPIPDGLWVLHKCDVPACVRPDHLFLGTQRDNNNDRTAKGRGGRVGTRVTKFGEDDVREIRRLYNAGMTQREVGEKYGVTQATVSNIITGRTFGYVK